MVSKPISRKAVIKYIERLKDKWLEPLGLLWWHKIEFIYEDDRSRFKTGNDAEIETIMQVIPDWTRLWVEVEINVQAIRLLPPEDLEYAFVHEMMHILLAELECKGKQKDREERVVTNLARAFLWTREQE